MKTVTINGVKTTAIQIKKLIVDQGYQRAEFNSKARHAKMAARWSWNQCGSLIVAKRKSGKYAVVDGQNRLSAIILKYPKLKIGKKDLTVSCQIINFASPADEALFFIELNSSRIKVSKNSEFKARLSAKCPEEEFIVETLKDHGITLAYGVGRIPINTTKACHALRCAYDKVGEAGLEKVVEYLAAFTRPHDVDDIGIEKDALRADFILGMVRFHLDNERDHQDVIEGLANGRSAADILQLAKAACLGWSREGRHTAIFHEIKKSISQVGLRKNRAA